VRWFDSSAFLCIDTSVVGPERMRTVVSPASHRVLCPRRHSERAATLHFARSAIELSVFVPYALCCASDSTKAAWCSRSRHLGSRRVDVITGPTCTHSELLPVQSSSTLPQRTFHDMNCNVYKHPFHLFSIVQVGHTHSSSSPYPSSPSAASVSTSLTTASGEKAIKYTSSYARYPW
jgi:hypothetical protein